LRAGETSRETFWAVRDVSFEIKRGTMVGVLGGNGAGKSTLLRMIGGIGRPDSGSIRTLGSVRALLDLGSGMHPDLSGIENTFLIGVVAGGLSRKEVRKRLDAIVAFAELEDAIEDPLRMFSTGMQMRLAFSIAVHTDPEILLVDEVLAVGDLGFQRKCLERIRQIKEEGCAILFVSHDTGTVRQLCDEALWMKGGRLVACGPAEVVAGQYVAEMSVETRRRMPVGSELAAEADSPLKLGVNRFGSLEMQINGVVVLNRFGQPTSEIESGDPVAIEISYDAPKPLESPVFSVSISNDERQDLFDVNTDSKGNTLPVLEGKGKLVLHIDRLDLGSGRYFVNVGAYEAAWSHAYDYHWHLYELLINSPARQFGILNVPHRWSLQSPETKAQTSLTPGR
jgi:lipopolysaccharide transport system ATP-binding protein